jgi:hypothetical protein
VHASAQLCTQVFLKVGMRLGLITVSCLPACMQVASMLGTLLMCACSLLLLVFRNNIGSLFSSDPAVVQAATATMLPLAVSLIGERHRRLLGDAGSCSVQCGAAVQLLLAATAYLTFHTIWQTPGASTHVACAQPVRNSFDCDAADGVWIDPMLLSQTCRWMRPAPARRLISLCLFPWVFARRRGCQHCPGWSDAWLWASAAGRSSKPADILGAGPAIRLPPRLQTADGSLGAVGGADWHCWTASPPQLLDYLQVWCCESSPLGVMHSTRWCPGCCSTYVLCRLLLDFAQLQI